MKCQNQFHLSENLKQVKFRSFYIPILYVLIISYANLIAPNQYKVEFLQFIWPFILFLVDTFCNLKRIHHYSAKIQPTDKTITTTTKNTEP